MELIGRPNGRRTCVLHWSDQEYGRSLTPVYAIRCISAIPAGHLPEQQIMTELRPIEAYSAYVSANIARSGLIGTNRQSVRDASRVCTAQKLGRVGPVVALDHRYDRR